MRISKDVMILEWLQGEVTSERFLSWINLRMRALKTTIDVITNPNLDDPHENALREKIIEFRGYGSKRALFVGFPDDVEWSVQTLTQDQLLNDVLYVNQSYWNQMSHGTRLPRIAAQSVRDGLTIHDKSNDKFLEIADAVRQGADFKRLILVGDGKKTIVLEGHSRLTAFALAADALPPNIDVIYGFTPSLSKWLFY